MPSPDKQDLIITHTFDAPAEKVWQAWTDPELVKQWWGPDGFTCIMAEIDLREGGTSIVGMRAPQEFGGQDSYNTWRYTKITPNKQLAWISHLSDKDGQPIDPAAMGMPADFPQGQEQVVTLEELGDGTTKVTVTEHGWTPGQMMEYSRMGMEQCLAKMEKALKE